MKFNLSFKAINLLAALFSFFLVIQLNLLTIGISVAALLFSLTYPFTKRFFKIPQLYLGVTFGFGILMAFSAVQGMIPLEAVILFIANIFWSIVMLKL